MIENRAPAQYCPYCGETDLWPHEASHGGWACRSCHRVFTVRMLGIAGRDAETFERATPSAAAAAGAVGSA